MPWEILKTFVWLGLTAFGGPAAHFAVFQRLLVGKGKWVSKEQYLKMLAAVNLIPGPNSTETAMLLGHARGGARGLLLAGFGFIVPAALVTLALVALYQEAASLRFTQGAFLGLKLAVLALITQALWDLLPHPRKLPQTWLLALSGFVMAGLGLVEWAVVLLVGLVMVLGRSTKMLSVEPIGLFWFFLLVGSTLFGSGYVLIGLMQEMVTRGWLSPGELLDALALGQITPGPLLTTATAAGYLAAGFPGAVLSTVGIFLPSFVFTFLVVGVLRRLEGHPLAEAFLKGASGAALGLIAWALWLLGRETLVGWGELLVALLALILLLRNFHPLPLLGLFALGGALWSIGMGC
ncbi:chromate transporter [Meiothermus cerbereus]|uniref:chromate transporter n=1 Tax=Meiothermus cerbereus TaxID=65552 RepID=UPI003EEFE960